MQMGCVESQRQELSILEIVAWEEILLDFNMESQLRETICWLIDNLEIFFYYFWDHFRGLQS